MARRLRNERTGAEYHVMNRGTARRTIFDSSSDFRFFLSGLARAVHRGEILVLAYALMRTHFHLLLRSCGGLSVAMQRTQLRHVRRFNRTHRRDGPLMRGRFLAKRVSTTSYRRNAVRYIHENPVLARLCKHPGEYPWSSAWRLAREPTPRWLCDDAIRASGPPEASPRPVMEARAELMEARLRSRTAIGDDEFAEGTRAAVLAWMKRKALLADGAVHPVPQAGLRALLGVLESMVPGAAGAVTGVPGAGTYATHNLLAAGLLREIAACSFSTIAAHLGLDTSKARRLARFHLRCIAEQSAYAISAATVVSTCLRLIEDVEDPGATEPGVIRAGL